ncbi:unnamed protein product [Amoebophrya sp. A25]|nr:unnamed protein product [Amoebophrya sp. A25]|eukprot:GSA25T00012409001.1
MTASTSSSRPAEEGGGPLSSTTSTSTSSSSETISERFYRLYPRLKRVSNSGDGSCADLSPEGLKQLVTELRTLVTEVERSSVFSDNEDIDDLLTEDLKFLLLPQMVGDALALDHNMETRFKSLSSAIISWQMYLSRAGRFNLVDAEDQDAVFEGIESGTAQQQREGKISRYKRDQELEKKIDYFFARVAKMGGEEEAWTGGGVDEEMARSCILDLLRKGVLHCIEEVAAAKRELPMLEMFSMRAASGAPLQFQGPDEDQKKRPWQISIRDPSELKQLFQNSVFQPDIPMPTVTLAEYADYEMAKLADQKADKDAAVVAEYTAKNQEVGRGGPVDDHYKKERDEEDMKEAKQRSWDDWVDFNPKGIGNKMKNTS